MPAARLQALPPRRDPRRADPHLRAGRGDAFLTVQIDPEHMRVLEGSWATRAYAAQRSP